MNFSAWALQLNVLLEQHQALWRHNAYQSLDLKPFNDYPELLPYLLTLSDSELFKLQADDRSLLRALLPYFPPAAELLTLITLATPENPSYCEPPSGIPGRKWQQIQAFINAHPSDSTISKHHFSNTPVIEWCSGKGYLSEAMVRRYQLKSVGLEIDQALVASGNVRAASTNISRHIVNCDVFSDLVFQYVDNSQQILALHACGGLHKRLLRTAVSGGSPRLSLSPCCYHRFNDGEYQNQSTLMRSCSLNLSNEDLRTAVRQTLTARAGETIARRQLQARYFALRVILNEQGLAADISLPSTAQHLSKATFTDWMQAVLALKPLAIHIPSNSDHYEALGWQYLHKAERVELVRMAFRRAIELHCVLDSVLFLQEHHYHCTLSEFCPTALTPRNLLIQADKLTPPQP